MAAHPDARRKGVLEQIARRAMKAYGFLPDFSADALRQLETVPHVEHGEESPEIDLRHLRWASNENGHVGNLERRAERRHCAGSIHTQGY